MGFRLSTLISASDAGAAPYYTESVSSLHLDDDHLVLDFPYDAQQVAEVKRIYGAKWDKVGRVWRLPMVSLDDARDFAGRCGIPVSSELMIFTLPTHKNEQKGIYINGNWIYLSFGYDPVMIRSVKGIAGITWHAKTKAWRAPMTSIAEVVKWGDTFKQFVPDDVRDALSEVENSLTELKEASRLTDADI